jgi:hypothetical protein
MQLHCSYSSILKRHVQGAARQPAAKLASKVPLPAMFAAAGLCGAAPAGSSAPEALLAAPEPIVDPIAAATYCWSVHGVAALSQHSDALSHPAVGDPVTEEQRNIIDGSGAISFARFLEGGGAVACPPPRPYASAVTADGPSSDALEQMADNSSALPLGAEQHRTEQQHWPHARVRGHVVLKNTRNTQYTGQIGVGTPPQFMTVIFDTGSNSLVLTSDECWQPSCWAHTRFRRKESSTFEPADRYVQMNFAGGSVQGPLGYDSWLKVPSALSDDTAP